MTQLDKFIALYKECGIDLEIVDWPGKGFSFRLEAKTHDKLSGYVGFFTVLHFDIDGNFLRQNFYEE